MLIPFQTLVHQYGLSDKIKGILHIGAHECEEQKDYLHVTSNILWIEANPDLVQAMRMAHPEYTIYQGLVSNTDDLERDFIVTNNGQSSSMLELNEHLKEHPHVFEIQRKRLRTVRMDTLLTREAVDVTRYNFLNLDIQGAELMALEGLGALVTLFNYIYTEVNEKELYSGCALLPQLDAFLKGHGLTRVQLKMTIHGWGDAFYIKT